jgi:hypothetical protein
MRPPPIYPQFPHLHNHGLAMLACITPLQNMRPPQYIEANWKEVLEEVIFSSNIIKALKSSRDEAWKKGEEEKEKLQKSFQIKGKLTFWEEKDTSTSKNPFWCDPIFSPSIIPFQKPFTK